MEKIKLGTRRLWVHAPKNLKSKNEPVFILFHGGSMNALQHAEMTKFNELADSTGSFSCCYVEGTDRYSTSESWYSAFLNDRNRMRTWNAGHGAMGWAAQNGIDDLGFINKLAKIDLIKIIDFDTTRIYLNGFSLGSMVGWWLLANSPQLYAAAALFSGGISARIDAPYVRPLPPYATPVYYNHGRNDTHVPFNGGYGSDSLFPFDHVPVTETIGFQKKVNSQEKTQIVPVVFAPTDLGHTWPIDGANTAWNFCKSWRRTPSGIQNISANKHPNVGIARTRGW